MNQATEPTAPAAHETPAPGTEDEFQKAHRIAGDLVARLTQRPFAVEVEEDWPAGHRAHLKFRESRSRGLLEYAAIVGVGVTSAETPFGVHLDAYTRIEDVEVRASALVSPAEAAKLERYIVPAPLQTAAHAIPTETEIAPAEDPCHPCGCPKRFNRHAYGCPETASAEDTMPLATVTQDQPTDAPDEETVEGEQ